MQTIKRKAKELKYLRMEVHETLFANRLCVPKRKVSEQDITNRKKMDVISRAPAESVLVMAGMNAGPVQWLVATIWHDWLQKQINNINNIREDESIDSMESSQAIAELYLTVSKGGDLYLPFDAVISDWHDDKYYGDRAKDSAVIRTCLALMKDYASNAVKPLVVNEDLQLKEAEAEKLGHLTCVKVSEEELPWMDKKNLKGENVEMAD